MITFQIYTFLYLYIFFILINLLTQSLNFKLFETPGILSVHM